MATAMLQLFWSQTLVVVSLLILFNQTKRSTSTVTSAHPNGTTTIRCSSEERSALLAFRAGLSDPENLLSSWEGDDCCYWKGVRCSNRTGHVVKLDLQGNHPYYESEFEGPEMWLGGSISFSLLRLQHLQYLNISNNNFSGEMIPEFLGSLRSLRYLDLSESGFVGSIPPQLGNLSNLRYLSIFSDSDNDYTYSTDITWLSRLSSLEHLDMGGVNLSTILDWVPVVNMLPSLKVIRFSMCQLSSSPDALQHSNLTSLETLDVSWNNIDKYITPNWFWDLTSLRTLDISYNQFHGPFPDELGNMTSLVRLKLGRNKLHGMIPSTLSNLCNLQEIFLEYNINGSIAEFFQSLPSCSWNKLQILFIPGSNLTGSLPTNLEPLRNLTMLYLSRNKLTGPLPLWIGKLTKLTELDLSFNNLDGIIHEGHLSDLLSLESLTLTDNSITIMVKSDWVPPFNLTYMELRSCTLGPKFPMWLRWQTRLRLLDISNTSISDMVPDWFWVTASSMRYLNIRNNQIRGPLPSTLEFMSAIAMDLSSNQISGPIPKLPINLTQLDLSKNNLSGPLPLDFGAPRLTKFLLYDNSIAGLIPSSLCKLQSLAFLDLSRNKLTGSIPDCLDTESRTSVTSLSIINLSLRNNNLSGEFPPFLKNCKQLILLDLADNLFFGVLPAWIGEKLPSLAFLRLRSNMFYGHIPVELTKLIKLQYLDLAYNNISGIIPKSFANYMGMTLARDVYELVGAMRGFIIGLNDMDFTTGDFMVVTKGQERLYTDEIIYMVNLDLSCNKLVGEIPENIGSLAALKNLNLSWNAFSGKIPEKIGALVQVESLDLSHNELSGEIPTSLSALTSLSRLNLSYNNLTGNIPSGNQLRALDDPASIYIGNPGLCGPPLSKNCSETGLTPASIEYHRDGISFFLAVGAGYAIGLWVVFCIFLFKRKWRMACFSLYDSMYDCVYVHVAVTWSSMTRKSL